MENTQLKDGVENAKKKMGKRLFTGIRKSFQSQQFKSGAYSSLLTILVVIIVIGINLLFTKLDLSTDLSSGSLFTLSKDSKKVVKDLDQNVTVYYMVQDSSQEDHIYNVLKQYPKVSKHITMKKVDPVVKPGFAKSLGITDDISSNDVIVVNNKTKAAKYIAGTEMYYSQQDYTSGSSEYYLDVEGQVTSAIQNVVLENKTKMYIMTKHSEQEIGDSLSSALEKMNIKTSQLELAKKGSVPKDCDILLLNGPTKDITQKERDEILKYLKNGGKAMINVGYTTEKTPNLDKVLAYYGVTVTKGIIYEGTGNYATYLNYIVPTVKSDATMLSDLNGYVIFPDAQGLTAAGSDSLRSTVSITDLMDTSDDSYVKTDPSSQETQKEEGDVDGPFSVGLSITEKVDSEKETKLIVYASAGAFSENLAGTSQLDNGTVFKNSVSTISDTKTKEVSIDKKSLSYSYISVTSGTQLLWAGIMILIIPGGLLLTGFSIWFVRRRK